MVSSFRDFFMFAALFTWVNSFTLETASRVNRRTYVSRISTLLDSVYFYIILELNVQNLKRKRRLINFHLKNIDSLLVACLKAQLYLSSYHFYFIYLFCIIQLGFNPRQGIKFLYGSLLDGKRDETGRRIYTREKTKEKKKRRKKSLATASRIENSTANDASGFFVAVSRVRCMDVPDRKFWHPGDRMNSVNKKCALECTVHEFSPARVFFHSAPFASVGLMSCIACISRNDIRRPKQQPSVLLLIPFLYTRGYKIVFNVRSINWIQIFFS